MRPFAFPPRLRLTAARDFDRVFKRGVRSADRFFLVIACANDTTHPRLGLAVSKKAAGNAVNRHRVKRVVREQFRLARETLPPADVVVVARGGTRDGDNATLAASLEGHWARITERCAG